jgi:hypothetical protein
MALKSKFAAKDCKTAEQTKVVDVAKVRNSGLVVCFVHMSDISPRFGSHNQQITPSTHNACSQSEPESYQSNVLYLPSLSKPAQIAGSQSGDGTMFCHSPRPLANCATLALFEFDASLLYSLLLLSPLISHLVASVLTCCSWRYTCILVAGLILKIHPNALLFSQRTRLQHAIEQIHYKKR